MKVIFVTRDLDLGGVAHCVSLVASGLAKRGIEVEIIVLEGRRNVWPETLSDVKVTYLYGLWQSKKPWTWLAGWRAVRARLKLADVIIAATFLMPLYMSWTATRGLSHRFIAWVHGPMAELDAFARMNPVHRFLCQTHYRHLSDIVCVSDHTRHSLARWLKIPVQPGWLVIPNFTRPHHPRPLHLPTAPLQLLFVGRIAEEKQPHLWLDTLESLNTRKLPAHLTVVGEGPLQDWLEKEATRRGLASQLNLIGPVSQVSEWMRKADWLLLTSQFEGFGLVVLEAMQVGLPIVSTHSGGVCELFAGRLDDFVTQVPSGSALADKLIAQQSHYAEISTWVQDRAKMYAPDTCLDLWMSYLSLPPFPPTKGGHLNHK